MAAAVAALALVFTGVSVTDSDARTRRSRKVAAELAASATATLPPAAPLITGSLSSDTPRSSRAQVPLVAAVSLNAQTVTIYAGSDVVARSPISSGMSGYATPTGVFSIIQKARYHESNIYDNAPMPFMQRLTWSGVAFHAGKLPGYPASHGCVRLPSDFAERLFGMLKMGTRVVVAPEVASPAPIVHAALPKPIYSAVPMMANAAPLSAPSAPYLTLASVNPPARDTQQLLSPPQWAEFEKRRAQAALADAQILARSRLDAAQQSALASDDARAERTRVEREIASFKSLLDRANAQRERASDDEARVQALASIYAFEDAIADASDAMAQLRKAEDVTMRQSFDDARAARAAEDEVERADAALKLASRGADPITIFVSRADGRVQVRQGFQTILAGDVQIRDPGVPLGTHVMTAGPLRSPDEGLTWTSLSISDGGIRGYAASDALARIAFEPELADAIGRRTWSGATLLISDQPASKETGKGTDFVILTK